jgi:tRNA pseudouridine38-40 synthase
MASVKMRRIRLLLEYDGSDFSGWQVQPETRTVQGVLQEAISGMMGGPVRIVGSGRTDAGVHALGQVAHADITKGIPPWNIMMGLNSALPRDVRVLECSEASPDFHAQRSATGKLYRYVILNRKEPTAIDRHRVWHVRQPLDINRMCAAARILEGRHDFAAFKSAGDETTTVRDLRKLMIEGKDDRVNLDFEADGFLKHMVRNITGALVEVGLGRMTPENVRTRLASRSRLNAPRKAPARGLFLIQVVY